MAWVGCSWCVYSAWGPRCQDSACVEVQLCDRTVCKQAGTQTWFKTKESRCAQARRLCLKGALYFTVCLCFLGLALSWFSSEQPGSVCLSLRFKRLHSENVDVSLYQTNKETLLATCLPWPVLSQLLPRNWIICQISILIQKPYLNVFPYKWEYTWYSHRLVFVQAVLWQCRAERAILHVSRYTCRWEHTGLIADQ